MPTKRIEYFPLDTRVFYDMKFELLVAEFGLEAAAIAIKLLCEIYGNCFYLDWNANRCTIFTLHSGSTFSREQVQAIVDYLLEIDFFDKNMYEAYSILTSKGIQRRYFQITRRRKRNTMEHPEYLLVELPGKSNSIGNVSTKTELKPQNVDKNEIQVDLNSKNVDNFSQRKGKERKVNLLLLLLLLLRVRSKKTIVRHPPHPRGANGRSRGTTTRCRRYSRRAGSGSVHSSTR